MFNNTRDDSRLFVHLHVYYTQFRKLHKLYKLNYIITEHSFKYLFLRIPICEINYIEILKSIALRVVF